MITIICPTRGRPELCKRMVESALSTAEGKINIYLGIAGGTNEIYDNIKNEVQKFSVGELPTVAVSNFLADCCINNTSSKLLAMIGDDVIFSTKGWDTALLAHYNKLENKQHVYSFLDSRSNEGTPHPIVTREYVETMGYFMPPLFLHWFADTWTVDIAKYAGCFTHLKDFLLVHDKPSDRGVSDATHNRIRDMGWHYRDSYVATKCRHFLEVEKKKLVDARTKYYA